MIALDGTHKNPVTNGYICAKVRKFAERVYGPDRLLYPAVRKGPQGRRPFQAGHVGRSARSRRGSLPPRESGARRLLDSAVFIRRLERAADAGQHRRAAVAAIRHLAAGANAVRGADRRGQSGALRQDAVGYLSGLSGGVADRPVGRQPLRVGYSPGSLRARGAEARRQTGRHRPADDDAGRCGRGPPPCQAGHRRLRRSGDSSVPVHERLRRRAVPPRTYARSRPPARACRGVDDRAGGGRRRGRSGCARAGGQAVRGELAGADPVRVGPRAQPQRRQRGAGGARAARGWWKVRRPRRRLLDEQLSLLGHHAPLDRQQRARYARGEHESPRAGADRIRRSPGRRAVRL